MAPDGSHCETNANGAGSSGGDTAPPDELLPSTTKKSVVGTIAHRPTKTTITEANDATASRCIARMPQTSNTGISRRSRIGPSTSVRASEAASAKATTNPIQWRSDRPPASARVWNTVMKPTIVATSIK